MLKLLRPAFIAALGCAGAAAASPAGDIGGTWECRQPGVNYDNKPPILFISDTAGAQGPVDVDGFSRQVYGRSDVSADQDGWWKVTPAQGPAFMIKPEAASKQSTPTMGVRLADAKSDFRCLRLPPSAAQSIGAAPAAQGEAPAAQGEAPSAPAPGSDTQDVMQGTQAAPAPESQDVMQPAPAAGEPAAPAPAEEPAGKKAY